jgi:GNAT superfamily N-acetyltransferase
VVSEGLSIVRAEDPDAVHQPIATLLTRFNRRTVGEERRDPFALTIATPSSEEIVGGLWAFSMWGSFYVNIVVVPESARGQGLGSDLMRQAEHEARARGCRHMWLDTFDFQARAFYERLGFEVFGRLDGLAPYYPRYFMQKTLLPLREKVPAKQADEGSR